MGPCGSCASVHPNYHPLHTARALLMAGAPGTGKTVGSFGFFGGTLTDLKFWRENERVMKKNPRRLQIYQTNKWNPMNHTIRWTIWSIFTLSFIHRFLKAKDQALRLDLGSQPIPGPGFGSCTRAGIEGWQLGHSTHPRVSQRFWHFWTYIDVNIQGWEVPVLMAMIVWLAMTILIYIYIYVHMLHMYDYDNWKMHHSCVMLHSHDSHVMSWSFPVRKSCRYLSAQWLVVRFTLRRFGVPG